MAGSKAAFAFTVGLASTHLTGAVLFGSVSERRSCSCLPWKEVYEDWEVKCGAVHEFWNYHHGHENERSSTARTYYKQQCINFFKRLSTNQCVNLGTSYNGGDPHGGQWCYVPNTCHNLNGGGGEVALVGVKWKYCKKGEDAMLRDRTPEELFKFAHEFDVDFGMLLRMAYPSWEKQTFGKLDEWGFWVNGTNPDWSSARYLFQNDDRDVLVHAMTDENYMIFNIGENVGSLENALVAVSGFNEHVYTLSWNANRSDDNMGTWYNLECEKGCQEGRNGTIFAEDLGIVAPDCSHCHTTRAPPPVMETTTEKAYANIAEELDAIGEYVKKMEADKKKAESDHKSAAAEKKAGADLRHTREQDELMAKIHR